MDLREIETPVGVLDLDRVRNNANRAAKYCRSNGLAWRPHVKTHKSLEIARIQLDAGACGLTVATPFEAEVMSQVSNDLLLAYPPVGASKLTRLSDLPPSVDLKVGLDSLEVLEPLAKSAAAVGRTFGILVELDAGARRVGVTDLATVVAMAKAAADLPGVRFDGLMFYPGHIRTAEADQAEDLARVADFLAHLLKGLEEAEFAPSIVSGGSTPTMWNSHKIPGMTEIRAGTCIYNDRDTCEIGVSTMQDVAYSVLATVVSTAVPGQVVIDAGSKALAKESFRSSGGGFGILLDRPEVCVHSLSEEHGLLDVSSTDWAPNVGEQVRIVPNHVCVSVNLHEHLWAVDEASPRPVFLDGRGRIRQSTDMCP